ncbi:hypothetical protein HD806DRAFT_551102 [Xylariaceae sp. AK1471]|nr:hypothetical protein HD806DRAFT_551102 [Xylariaceae sp. AK1471]
MAEQGKNVDFEINDSGATGRINTTTTIARVPIPRQIHKILAPWRPLHWREVALQLWRDRNDEEVRLCTHYEGDSDEKFAGLRETAEDIDPAFEEYGRTWIVFDDQTLFNGKWSTALYVLPELVGPTSGCDAYSYRYLGDPEELEALLGELRKSVASALHLEGQGNDGEKLKVDDVGAG